MNQAFRAQTNNDYIINPGDIIRIQLRNYPEYSEDLFVDFSGSIQPNLIGKVYIHGFTLNDLEVTITRKYSRVLIKPVVQVQILSQTQQAVYVAGKIKNPGVVRYRQRLTVAQSISLAGGVRKVGREYSAYVLRKKTDGSWTKFEIKLKRKGSNSKGNNGAFKLSPYDIVYVVKSTEMRSGALTHSHEFGTEI